METFASTEYTATVVIYRYSSPSSFQLYENKKSRKRSSKTASTEQVNIVAVFLFTDVYTHTGAMCSIRVTLRRSKMRLWLLTRPLTVGLTTRAHADTHAHTHTYNYSPSGGAKQVHVLYYIYTLQHPSSLTLKALWSTGGFTQRAVLLPVCILFYVIIGCGSTIKQTGVQRLALLSPGKDTRQRAQPHLLFLLLTLRLLQIF